MNTPLGADHGTSEIKSVLPPAPNVTHDQSEGFAVQICLHGHHALNAHCSHSCAYLLMHRQQVFGARCISLVFRFIAADEELIGSNMPKLNLCHHV